MRSLPFFFSALNVAERRLILGVAVLEALLMFVWSITGTIALRHGLLLLLIVVLPFIRLDKAALRHSLSHGAILLLGVLSVWIVLHNLFFAWDAGRAWYESVQWFKSMLCLVLGIALACTPRAQGGLSAGASGYWGWCWPGRCIWF